MKSIELVTFVLMVFFIGAMTVKHNDQVVKDQQAAETLEQGRVKQEQDKEDNAVATKATIRHDGSTSTNTVFVTLDASSSFDGGNVANQIYYDRFVPDKTKPICLEYAKDCTPTMGKECECEKLLKNACDEVIYEPLCAKYEEGCDQRKGYNNVYRGNAGNIGSGCRCVEYLEVLVEYVDDCEYQVLDHKDRESYLKSMMSAVTPAPNQRKQYEPDSDLSYNWEQLSGPVSSIQKNSKKSKFTLELGEGEYMFRCTVSDKYGAKDAANHRVIVSREPNNPPEANVMGTVLLGNPNKTK